MGKLFMANPSASKVDYHVNDGPKVPNRPCSAGPTPPPYTPFFVFAGLQPYPAAGKVAYGDNAVSATFWDEGTPSPPYSFSFSLDRRFSINDNLIAYVFRGWLLLADDAGVAVPPNPLLIEGSPAPPELQVSVKHTPKEEPHVRHT